jgi:1,4-alpha-glucan branching enzyme
MATDAFNAKSVLELDSWLEPFLDAIENRHQLFKRWKDTIVNTEGGYDQFTKGYLKFGLNVRSDNSVVYREWAPNAISAALTGDFSLSPALIGVNPRLTLTRDGFD